MEVKITVELGESAQKAFFALAKLFSENSVETVKVTNPEIAKMREAVEEGEKISEKVKEGQQPKEEVEDANVTLDTVRQAFIAKNNAKVRPKLKAILDELGVEKITDLQPAQYSVALEKLEKV